MPGREVIKGVSLHVRRGEVVGIAGLMGAGRTELAMSVFGRAYGRNIRGKATLEGRKLDLSTIEKAIAQGLAYVTEDRKVLGLVLTEEVRTNITLANLEGVSERGVIDDAREVAVASRYRQALRIRTPSIHQRAINLSGGNQQKVVLGEMAVHRAEGADARRADARHRRRRQIRDLRHHQRTGGAGEGRHRHLLGNAGAARRLRPHLCDERRPVRRRNAGQGSQPGEDHGVDHAPIWNQAMSAPAVAPSTSATREMRSELWKDNLRDYGLLLSLLLIVAFFYFITEDHASVAPVNITNLVMQNSYVVIMALGMLLVIVGGNIDLSVGSIVGFVGAVAGSLIVYRKVALSARHRHQPGDRRGDRRGAGGLGRLRARSRRSS